MKKARQMALITAITFLLVQIPEMTLANETYVSTNITVSEETDVGPASETMLGINDVWNNGIAMTSNASTAVSEKYINAIKSADMPIFFSRMAGSESQTFRWKEALGKYKERGFYSDSGKTMNMGLIEWLGYSMSISPESKFAFCLNMLEETPEDHADLVRFLCLEPTDPKAIGQDGTNWALERVNLGFKAPVIPEVFELGNELDYSDYTNGTYGNKDSSTSTTAVINKANWYIDLCNDSIDAMKAVSDDIKFSAIAFTAAGTETGTTTWRKAWNQKIISQLGSVVDYIDVHHYYSKNSGYSLKNSVIGDDIQEYINDLSGQKPKIYISEHALWSGTAPEEFPDRLKTTSLYGALQISRVICQMSQMGNVDKLTYHAMNAGTDTVDAWGNGWAVVRKFTDGNYYVTGAGETLKTLAPAFDGGRTIGISVSGAHDYYENTSSFGDAANSDGILIATATKSPDDSMNIVLVNTNETVGHHIAFSGTNSYKLHKTYTLTADDITADNNPNTPNGLYMKASLNNLSDSFLSYTLAPKSVVVLKLVPLSCSCSEESLQFSVNDKVVSNSAANVTGRFSVTVRGYDNKSTSDMSRVSLIVYPQGSTAENMVYLSTNESARELSKFYIEMPQTAANGNYIVSACTESGERNQFVLAYTGENTQNDISHIAMHGGNTEINGYHAQADIYFTNQFAVGDSYNYKVLSADGTCVFLANAQKTAAAPNTVDITMPFDAVKGRYTVVAETSAGHSAYTEFNFNKTNEAVSITDTVKNQNDEAITIENMLTATKLKINVLNRTAQDKAIKVLTAAYDSDGVLLNVASSEEQTILGSGSANVEVPVSFASVANCIKVFVWSLDSVAPNSYAYYIK